MKKCIIISIIIVALVGVLSFFVGKKVGTKKELCKETPVVEELNISQTGKEIYSKFFTSYNSTDLLSNDEEKVANAKLAIVVSYLIEDDYITEEKNEYTVSNSYLKGYYKEMFNEELKLTKGSEFSFKNNVGKETMCSVEEKDTSCSYVLYEDVTTNDPLNYVVSQKVGDSIVVYLKSNSIEYYAATFKNNNGKYYFVSIEKSNELV